MIFYSLIRRLKSFVALKEDVSVVLMLCEIVENGRPKCIEYWPMKEGENKTYGNVSVYKIKEENKSIGQHQRTVISTLEVAMTKCAPRTVLHMHWANWPDRGVPNESFAVLKLMRYVGQCNLKQQVVVHCSAGIGRTGITKTYCL